VTPGAGDCVGTPVYAGQGGKERCKFNRGRPDGVFDQDRIAGDRQATARRNRCRRRSERAGRALVGHLAKLAGARAVGIAGGPEKCAFVKDELRFDVAVDHRAADFPARLAAACPDGIDVYFENVGGAIWQAVLPLLNNFARVTVSGLIAQYNSLAPGDGTDRLPATMRQILSKSLTVRGFINNEFARRAPCRLPARGRCRHR
jgi:hypothetical protein